MARTNYKCPQCKKQNGMNNAYCNGSMKHRCKHCGCEVTVLVIGSDHWQPDWICKAIKRKGKKK